MSITKLRWNGLRTIVRQIVKDFLKDHLTISVSSRSEWCDSSTYYTVSLELDGEEISSCTFSVQEGKSESYY